MNVPSTDWIHFGSGKSPKLRWLHEAEGRITAASLAKETAAIFIADQTGALAQVLEDGQLGSYNRGGVTIRSLAWSDDGSHGVALQGKSDILRLDSKLRTDWEVEVNGKGTAIAISPFANYCAIALADGASIVLDRHHKRVGVFETFRPLQYLTFLIEEEAIVGAGKDGILCSHSITGDEDWTERLWTNAGTISVSEGNASIYVAALAQGAVEFSLQGKSLGAFSIEGTVKQVSASYHGDVIFLATVELELIKVNREGKVRWSTSLPEPVHSLHCSPLGDWVVVCFKSGYAVCLGW